MSEPTFADLQALHEQALADPAIVEAQQRLMEAELDVREALQAWADYCEKAMDRVCRRWADLRAALQPTIEALAAVGERLERFALQVWLCEHTPLPDSWCAWVAEHVPWRALAWWTERVWLPSLG